MANKKPKNAPLSDEKRAKITTRLKAGEKLSAVAAVEGCSVLTVRRYRDKLTDKVAQPTNGRAAKKVAASAVAPADTDFIRWIVYGTQKGYTAKLMEARS